MKRKKWIFIGLIILALPSLWGIDRHFFMAQRMINYSKETNFRSSFYNMCWNRPNFIHLDYVKMDLDNHLEFSGWTITPYFVSKNLLILRCRKDSLNGIGIFRPKGGYNF